MRAQRLPSELSTDEFTRILFGVPTAFTALFALLSCCPGVMSSVAIIAGDDEEIKPLSCG